jgi:ketosteroid isomerase-like protein
MGQEPRGSHTENLALARKLIPPEGNDFAAIVDDRHAEERFMARVRPLLHSQYETVWRDAETGGETRTGAEATLGALHQIGAAFETLVAFPELYLDLGDRVLVLVRREGRTLDGIDFRESGAAIYVFQDGLLRRMQMYADRASALADVGLSPSEVAERGVAPDQL